MKTSKIRKRPNCCLIAKTCLNSLGFPEHSLESTALKILADEFILKTPEGKRDYVKYVQKAPKIVQAIQNSPDRNKTWLRIYGSLLAINQDIQSHSWQEAYQGYKTLILDLENQFLNWEPLRI